MGKVIDIFEYRSNDRFGFCLPGVAVYISMLFALTAKVLLPRYYNYTCIICISHFHTSNLTVCVLASSHLPAIVFLTTVLTFLFLD